MKYHHLIEAFYSNPWAILPEKLDQMRAFLMLKAKGDDVPDEDVQAIVAARRDASVRMSGRVACVPVFGVLAQRMGMMGEISGGISTERLGATLDDLVADKQVKCVLLCFDSPGGSVFGIPELADKIMGYRGKKKVCAIADSVCASAAYWLMSQCAETACTPGGQVGSIGVIAAHTDCSKWEELQGYKTTIVTAGKYKAEMAEEAPLSEDARAELQAKVDHYYGVFTEAVARGRDTTATRVRSDMGQGRMLTAKAAKAAGMIDRIETFPDFVERLGGDPAPNGPNDTNAQRAAVRARIAGVETDDWWC